jgi:shikimate kinase / 3-dehydroquinate synthase
LGLVAALRVGQRLGVTPPVLVERVIELLARLELPTDLSKEPLAEAAKLIALDKKRKGTSVKFVLVHGAGHIVFRSLELTELERMARDLAQPARAPLG